MKWTGIGPTLLVGSRSFAHVRCSLTPISKIFHHYRIRYTHRQNHIISPSPAFLGPLPPCWPWWRCPPVWPPAAPHRGWQGVLGPHPSASPPLHRIPATLHLGPPSATAGMTSSPDLPALDQAGPRVAAVQTAPLTAQPANRLASVLLLAPPPPDSPRVTSAALARTPNPSPRSLIGARVPEAVLSPPTPATLLAGNPPAPLLLAGTPPEAVLSPVQAGPASVCPLVGLPHAVGGPASSQLANRAPLAESQARPSDHNASPATSVGAAPQEDLLPPADLVAPLVLAQFWRHLFLRLWIRWTP